MAATTTINGEQLTHHQILIMAEVYSQTVYGSGDGKQRTARLGLLALPGLFGQKATTRARQVCQQLQRRGLLDCHGRGHKSWHLSLEKWDEAWELGKACWRWSLKAENSPWSGRGTVEPEEATEEPVEEQLAKRAKSTATSEQAQREAASALLQGAATSCDRCGGDSTLGELTYHAGQGICPACEAERTERCARCGGAYRLASMVGALCGICAEQPEPQRSSPGLPLQPAPQASSGDDCDGDDCDFCGRSRWLTLSTLFTGQQLLLCEGCREVAKLADSGDGA